jgi:type II secretory pathway pseudopilin PulG
MGLDLTRKQRADAPKSRGLVWLRRVTGEQAGFTLIELLVTCLIFVLVLIAILSLLDVTSGAAHKDQERSTSLNEAAAGLRRMTTELRNTYRVLGPTGQATSNYMDVLVRGPASGSGPATAIRVLYTCDNTLWGTPYRECLRFESAPDSSQPPGSMPFPSDGEIVVKRISNGSAGDPVFTNLQTTGNGGQPVFGQVTIKVPAKGDMLVGNSATEVFSDGFYMPNLAVGH